MLTEFAQKPAQQLSRYDVGVTRACLALATLEAP